MANERLTFTIPIIDRNAALFPRMPAPIPGNLRLAQNRHNMQPNLQDPLSPEVHRRTAQNNSRNTRGY